jgi:hypothetical protein
MLRLSWIECVSQSEWVTEMATKKTKTQRVSRPSRKQIQSKLWDIVDAILDSEEFIASSGHIHFVQHKSDADLFSAYLMLSTGELTEERYDALRAIVNEHGGKLNVLESREDRDYNVRVWPFA